MSTAPGRSEGRSAPPTTLEAFLGWLASAPAGTSLDARTLHATLASLVATMPAIAPPSLQDAPEPTWRERLWTAPAEARLGVVEVAEAIGRPKSWVYRHTSEKAAGTDRLPHRKLEGELLFVAGEVRAWIKQHEEIVVGPRLRVA